MEASTTKYYPCWVRWQQLDGFVIWLDRPDPDREALWVDKHCHVPVFKSIQSLNLFANELDWELEQSNAAVIDLDAVLAWLQNPVENPVSECLSVWLLFDDLSAGSNGLFIGNQKTADRNIVFDLLYKDYGPWQSVEYRQWTQWEKETLCAILLQGFTLWSQCVRWTDA